MLRKLDEYLHFHRTNPPDLAYLGPNATSSDDSLSDSSINSKAAAANAAANANAVPPTSAASLDAQWKRTTTLVDRTTYIDTYVDEMEESFGVETTTPNNTSSLIGEDPMSTDENVDVGDDDDDVEPPKFLADIFESVAGAIFLDSHFSLQAVWNAYYKFFEPYLGEYPRPTKQQHTATVKAFI